MCFSPGAHKLDILRQVTGGLSDATVLASHALLMEEKRADNATSSRPTTLARVGSKKVHPCDTYGAGFVEKNF